MDLVSELVSITLISLALILSLCFTHCQNNGQTEDWFHCLINPWTTSYTIWNKN